MFVCCICNQYDKRTSRCFPNNSLCSSYFVIPPSVLYVELVGYLYLENLHVLYEVISFSSPKHVLIYPILHHWLLYVIIWSGYEVDVDRYKSLLYVPFLPLVLIISSRRKIRRVIFLHTIKSIIFSLIKDYVELWILLC